MTIGIYDIPTERDLESYPYLVESGLDVPQLHGIFTLQSSWGLQKRPKTGFYTNLIDFHQKYYSHVSQRDVGRAIHPWMQGCVDKKFPLNAYRKILRIKGKKADTDAELPYSTGKIY